MGPRGALLKNENKLWVARGILKNENKLGAAHGIIVKILYKTVFTNKNQRNNNTMGPPMVMSSKKFTITQYLQKMSNENKEYQVFTTTKKPKEY